MSRHGVLSEMAIEAMTDERRDELRQAAQTVADVFGMTRLELIEAVIPGTMGPDSEAELWAMTYGEPEPKRNAATSATAEPGEIFF